MSTWDGREGRWVGKVGKVGNEKRNIVEKDGKESNIVGKVGKEKMEK